jgi:hypothetical protein
MAAKGLGEKRKAGDGGEYDKVLNASTRAAAIAAKSKRAVKSGD